ncbi:hypothetical protein [Micromonospora sp. NBC_01412]|uniref:hypothetical protein n=1 Tax=Micromonospora sp. NBC_01412 TaxID=2903590 RepID=UPI003246CE95
MGEPASRPATDGPGMIGDGGYQGAGLLTTPKKPAGGDLTAEQKTYNYSLDRLPAPPRRV